MSLGLLSSWDLRCDGTCHLTSTWEPPTTQPVRTGLPLPPGQSIGSPAPVPVCIRNGISGGRRTSHPCTVPSVTDPVWYQPISCHPETYSHRHRTSALPFRFRVSGSSFQYSGAFRLADGCRTTGSFHHLPSKGKEGAWQINLQFCSWTGKSAKPILKQVIMRWKGQDYTAPYRCFAMPRCISSRGHPHRSRQ